VFLGKLAVFKISIFVMRFDEMVNVTTSSAVVGEDSPFFLSNNSAYRQWREQRLLIDSLRLMIYWCR